MNKDRSVLVTGLARNVAKHLHIEIIKIENEVKKVFNSVNFLIIESDSNDDTLEVLKNLKKTKNNFNYRCLGELDRTYPNRIERLTLCRNTYVQEIRENKMYSKTEFIMVIDFDLKNNRLNLTVLKDLINRNDWSGLFANQTGFYYDIYALRKKDWVEKDSFIEYRQLKENYNPEKAKEIAIWSKMIKISKYAKMISVDSAFGGLGLYRKNLFLENDYTNDSNDYFESEHVVFHKKIRELQGTLLIVPKLTNFSWGPHNLSKFKILRFLDRSTNIKSLQGIRSFIRKALP